MWIFTDFGFFSAVNNRRNPNQIVLRARVRDDLERLIEKYVPERPEIIANAGTDYKYRIYLDKSVWANILLNATMDIDYTNFKRSVHDKMGDARADSCFNVWNAMYALQE